MENKIGNTIYKSILAKAEPCKVCKGRGGFDKYSGYENGYPTEHEWNACPFCRGKKMVLKDKMEVATYNTIKNLICSNNFFWHEPVINCPDPDVVTYTWWNYKSNVLYINIKYYQIDCIVIITENGDTAYDHDINDELILKLWSEIFEVNS